MPLIRTESKFFITLVGLAAVSVATWAAVFSVTGLSLLYSGSILYVAIAMGVLEFSKIIVASYLYRHWKDTNILLRTYMTGALIILMLITSGGIYGYLTNSYQGATIGLEKIDSQAQVLNQRKQNLTEERERLTTDIATLRSERQSTIENRNNEIAANNLATDSASVKYRAWRNSQVHKRYNVELTRISDNISKYTEELDSTNVRLSRVNTEIADKKLEMIDTGVEVGPLVYMARLFNTEMDVVMKWFTLVIVLVFDPLAIALVLALNVVVARQPEKTEVKEGTELKVGHSDDEQEFGNLSEIGVKKDRPRHVGKYNVKSNWWEDDPFMKQRMEEEKHLEEIDDEIEEMEQEVVEKKRPRFSKPNPKKDIIEPLEKLADEIEETPTKDIVAPIEEEKYYPPDDVHQYYEDDYLEKVEKRIVQEPAKSGDIPKEKIRKAVESVKNKKSGYTELYDRSKYGFSPRPELELLTIEEEEEFDDIDLDDIFKDKQEEPDVIITEKKDPIEKYNEDIQPKDPLTNEEIREIFDDAVREERKKQVGKISNVVYESGGKVKIDHSIQDEEENIDFAEQE